MDHNEVVAFFWGAVGGAVLVACAWVLYLIGWGK